MDTLHLLWYVFLMAKAQIAAWEHDPVRHGACARVRAFIRALPSRLYTRFVQSVYRTVKKITMTIIFASFPLRRQN
jgi:hypothetical protein